MSKFTVTYRIAWWQYHPEYDEEFEPEDVMPYYDMYDSGNIVIFIKQMKKRNKWYFWPVTVEEIVRVPESKIKITVTEKPERKICGE